MGIGSLLRVTFVRICSIFYSKNRSKVIFYHDIHSTVRYSDMSTHISLFRRHINIIKESGYEIVPEITKKNGQIEICFDDAFLGFYDNFEFIRRKKIPVNLFVVPSFINQDNYMSEQQILDLSRSSFITISSHTYSHKLLNKLHKKEIYSELKNSKDYLENLLGKPVESICYPEGSFDANTIYIAEEVGYKRQYSSIPGFFFNPFLTNVIRRSLVQFAGEKEFRAILKGADHILALWYRLKHFKR